MVGKVIDIMKCPNCTKELRDIAQFCTHCGKPIPRCPSCGKVLQKRARFCTNDGTPIPDEINALLPEQPNSSGTEKAKHEVPGAKKSRSRNKKSNVKILIIVIAVLLAIAALAATFMMLWRDIDRFWFVNTTDAHNSSQDSTREIDPESESTTETSSEPTQETAPVHTTDAVPETSPVLLMPNCIGAYYNDAAYTIAAMNCTPVFEYVFSDQVELGFVIEQSFPTDSILTEGSTVTLIVSKGPDLSPEGYNQKIVVTANSGSSYGTMTLYNWENGQWVSAFSCNATVGKNGIGTDYGEGKGKTPQGVFKLGIALSANSISNTGWPFYRVTSDTCVVDDPDSQDYNTIQSYSSLASGVSYDPIGSTLVDGNSNVCIYIEHNGNGLTSDNVVSGKGSVITICGRTVSIAPTAGCVDISSSDMNTLISLLAYDKNPHIEIGTP